MHIATVVICTRNRAKSLRRTLFHLSIQEDTDLQSWNVIVVNNASEDETSEVIREFSSRLRIREVHELRLGVSHARNCGVLHADSSYIIWADDDVIPSPHWISAYLKAFSKYPELAIFGGQIDAVFEQHDAVPKWLWRNRKALHLMLTVRDPGGSGLPIPNARGLLPFTANCAVELAAIRQFAFDPQVGYAPNRKRGGEEMDVFERMLEAGYRGIWLPQAVVSHVLVVERQTREHVQLFYQAVGETAYLRPSSNQLKRLHVSKLITKWAVATSVCAMLSIIAPARSIRALSSASYHSGALRMLREYKDANAMPTYNTR